MSKKTNEKIKTSERTITTQTTAGAVLATSWAVGTTGLEIIEQLDSAITSLANLDFSEIPACKDKKSKEDTGFQSFEEYGKEILDAIPGCTAFSESIIEAKENPNAENIIKAIIDGVGTLLTAQDRFPACAVEQFRKFLAVLPIQYYLLVLLSKAAKDFRDAVGKDIAEETNLISTPCGESIEKLKNYENLLPEYELPLLPELPYIRIPSLLNIIENILLELACFAICAVTTPIIDKVAKVLINEKDAFKDYFLGDENNIQPLIKIPITPYLSVAAFESARQRNIIPKNVNNEQILSYIKDLQNREDIQQEEFIFLFLGQTNCNIILKVKEEKRTEELLLLDTDEKIINFFSLLGSFIDFIDLIDNSRAKVCPPNPCDISEQDLNRIVDSLNDLCGLLNPQSGLPPVPLSSIMEATGVNDFIVDGAFQSYTSVAGLNGLEKAYNFTAGKDLNGFQKFNTVTYVVPYIQTYLAASIGQLNGSIKGKGQEKTSLRFNTFKKAINYMTYIFPFVVNKIDRSVKGETQNYNSILDFYPGDTPEEKEKIINEDDILPATYQDELKIRATERKSFTIQHYTRYTKPIIKNKLEKLQASTTIQANKEQDMEVFINLKKEFGL